MPDRNFMLPNMPTQADVMYSINTLHEHSDDLATEVTERQLAREAEKGNPRLRRSRIIGMIIFFIALAIFAAYAIAQVLR